jgi:hypothetical protein
VDASAATSLLSWTLNAAVNRRRTLILVAIAAVVALDVALWLRLFTPDEVDDASAASSGQSSATEPATDKPLASDDDAGTGAGTGADTGNSDDSDTPKRIQRISLGSYTQKVGLLETVSLSGRYPDAPGGTSLYVQRLSSNGWETFPLPTVVTKSGRFEALAQLGQPGPNRLRLVDPATQTTSEVVSITVR